MNQATLSSTPFHRFKHKTSERCIQNVCRSSDRATLVATRIAAPVYRSTSPRHIPGQFKFATCLNVYGQALQDGQNACRGKSPGKSWVILLLHSEEGQSSLQPGRAQILTPGYLSHFLETVRRSRPHAACPRAILPLIVTWVSIWVKTKNDLPTPCPHVLFTVRH